MRNPKLLTRNSTKAERRFAERLKSARIRFATKVFIGGREIDFIIGKYAIEIDGHTQDPKKNAELISLGYQPVHISNDSVESVDIHFYGKSSSRH